MPKKIKTIYKSKESIYAKFHRSGEWAEYSAEIVINEDGKQPIEIKMALIGQPSFFEMPEKKVIKAENITKAYEKITKYFRQYELEFRYYIEFFLTVFNMLRLD